MNMSDRIVILNEGRILQSGAPEALYNAPASRFVADFLGRANFLSGELSPLADGLARLTRGGAAVTVRAGAGSLLALRPERISVRAGGAADRPAGDGPATNRLAGRVASAVFNGAQVLYRVETDFGEILAIEPSFRAEGHLARGDAAELSWPVEAGVLLPEEPAP